jgi:Ca2+-binding EF-hand superfamily protein
MKLAAVFAVVMLSGVAHADNPQPHAQRGQLRALLLQHFDKNHDGRLGPRERRHAARALHRLAAKMMRGDMRQQRQRKFVDRFDRDGDGNVGPAEMPPGLADELRPLDRDGDGWLQGDELP